MTSLPYHAYKPSHPWYYTLGGTPPNLKAIRNHAINSDDAGYLADDIAKVCRYAEPKRSEQLQYLKDNITADLQRDITTYRQLRRQYSNRMRHQFIPQNPQICDDLDTSLSLNYNHLTHHFAHLHQLAQKTKHQLPRQLSLF